MQFNLSTFGDCKHELTVLWGNKRQHGDLAARGNNTGAHWDVGL